MSPALHNAVATVLRAPHRQGGRDPATGIDCLGAVLCILRAAGVAFPDPWRQLERDWVAGGLVPHCFPAGWERVLAPPFRDLDVLVWGAEQCSVGIVVGGYVIGHSQRQGGWRLLMDRFRTTAEVWRQNP